MWSMYDHCRVWIPSCGCWYHRQNLYGALWSYLKIDYVFKDCTKGICTPRLCLIKKKGTQRCSGGIGRECICFAQVAPLLYLNAHTNNRISGEFEFVRQFEKSSSKDYVSWVISFLQFRRETDDKVDHGHNQSVWNAWLIEMGERCIVVPYSSMMSANHLVGSYYCLSSFTSQLPWPLHRLFVSPFYQPRI